MAKGARDKIKLESTAGTGHFYTTTKNKRNMPEKMAIKKFDPVVRKHVEYKETKIKEILVLDRPSRPNDGIGSTNPASSGVCRLWRAFMRRRARAGRVMLYPFRTRRARAADQKDEAETQETRR